MTAQQFPQSIPETAEKIKEKLQSHLGLAVGPYTVGGLIDTIADLEAYATRLSIERANIGANATAALESQRKYRWRKWRGFEYHNPVNNIMDGFLSRTLDSLEVLAEYSGGRTIYADAGRDGKVFIVWDGDLSRKEFDDAVACIMQDDDDEEVISDTEVVEEPAGNIITREEIVNLP